MSSEVTLLIPKQCASKASSVTGKYTPRQPAKEPTHACLPNPCGKGSLSCKISYMDTPKCTCKPGWEKTKRGTAVVDDANAAYPCDSYAGCGKCPANHKCYPKTCAYNDQYAFGAIPQGKGCGTCVDAKSCVSCKMEQDWESPVIGAEKEVCVLKSMTLNPGLKAGAAFTKPDAWFIANNKRLAGFPVCA